MIVEGAFAGLEAMYQMADGEGRVMVLIELISKPVQLHVAPASLRKLA
jgi:transcriptional antiterminator RfaH